jgi:hypothetical protein
VYYRVQRRRELPELEGGQMTSEQVDEITGHDIELRTSGAGGFWFWSPAHSEHERGES